MKSTLPPSCQRSHSLGLIVFAGLFIFTLTIQAATDTWKTAPGNSNWGTKQNWSTGRKPVTGDLLQFTNSSRTALNNNIAAGTSFAGINFTTNASAFTFTGNSTALTRGITNNSTKLQTINLAIVNNDTTGLTISTIVGGGNISLGGVISGADALIAAGTGTTTLKGVNTYTNTTTVNSGSTLVIGGTGSLNSGSYAGKITNSGTFIDNSTAAQILSGVISGAGDLAQNGTGTLTLAGTNTYTGATTINAGTVTAGAAAGGQAFGHDSAVNLANVAGATLNLAGFNQTIGSLAGGGSTGGNVTLGSGTLTSRGDNTNASYAGVISGTGGLVEAGTGTQTLTGSNTYSGGTTLNEGTLAISNNAALGTGTVTFASNSTVLALANLTVTNAYKFSSGVTGTLDVGPGLTLTNSGAITGAGILDKIDSGTLQLSGTSTVSTSYVDGGSLVVTGVLSNTTGTISVGNTVDNSSLVITNGGKVEAVNIYAGVGGASNSILVTGSNSSANLNGGVLYVGTFGNGSDTLVITNGGSVTNSQFAIIGNGATSSNNVATVTGVGSLWSNSSGTFVGLSGSGNSLVISNGGVVASATATIIGENAGSSNNSILVTGSGSYLSNTATGYIDVGNSGSGTLTVANGGVAEAQTIAIALTNGTTGTLNIGFLGGTDSAGTLKDVTSIIFGSGSATLNFNQTNSFTLSAPVSGVGSVNQLGTGTTILATNNTFTGTTTVAAGTLLLSTNGTLSGTTNVVVNGGTLLFGGSNSINTSANLTLGGGTLSLGGGTSRASDQTFNTLTLTANSVIDFADLSDTSDLTFSSITGLSSYSLSIYDWNGTTQYGTISTTGGTNQTTQLMDLSGLKQSELSHINFYSGLGTGFLGNGTFQGSQIIPVPEPSVIFSALFLLGWIIGNISFQLHASLAINRSQVNRVRTEGLRFHS